MRVRLLMAFGIRKALKVAQIVKKAKGPVWGLDLAWSRPFVTTLGLGAVFSFLGLGYFKDGDDSLDQCDGYVCTIRQACVEYEWHCNNLCWRTSDGSAYCQTGWQCGCS